MIQILLSLSDLNAQRLLIEDSNVEVEKGVLNNKGFNYHRHRHLQLPHSHPRFRCVHCWLLIF